MHLNWQRDLTGNQESTSAMISGGRFPQWEKLSLASPLDIMAVQRWY